MHNTDRTQQFMEAGPSNEFEYEGGEFEFEFEGGEFEGGEFEFEGGEFEYEGGEFEFEGAPSHEFELELASELLGVSNEYELEQFFGKLFKKVAGGVRNFARSGVGRALGGALKGIAKQALPALASAAGNALLPGVGGALGGKLGGMAASALGLELEGLSAEDREFEVARRIVRLGTAATRQALRTPPGANPTAAARSAMTAAARRYAPGLLRRRRRRGYGGSCSCGGSSAPAGIEVPGIVAPPTNTTGAPSGSWYRQGNSIVIQGV